MLMQNALFFIFTGLLFLSACKTSGQSDELFSETGDAGDLGLPHKAEAPVALVGKGTAWDFTECTKQSLVGTELVEAPTAYKIYSQATVDQNKLTLVYTDEDGEEYTLVSDKPSATAKGTVWSGKASLVNAVAEKDVKPLILAYEVERDSANNVVSEIITTKDEMPHEYYDDNVKKAFEVNKFTSRGESITLTLMENATPAGYDYAVTRVCGKGGKGFSKTADAKRQPVGGEFQFEVSLQ